ncbi:hypothetical protein EGW08_019197 [Elysia chlorotica]|uniref:TNase-like domain-containing protein n=1 Tax=Elysia chlorotica TaxID=188477 RepID=A0A3S1AV46_ELYCH|nr:hypothetical protein EGW08_019197 [Elysia chlorotica]
MVPEPPPQRLLERSVHNFIDTHLRELQWTAYGLAGLGVALVLRRVKATTKFRRVSDIPAHFTTKNYRLQGHVRKISDSGELLVEHVPILQLNLFSNKAAESGDLLKVNIAGIALTPTAVEWLSETALDKPVWFRLLQARHGSLDCDVTLRLKQNWLRGHSSISEELVKRGLCAVRHHHTPPASRAYDRLLTRLLALEFRAQRRGKGLWGGKEYTGPGWWSNSVQWSRDKLHSLFRRREK